MFQELKFQFSTAILTILTLAAGVSAFINFQQQNRFQLARRRSDLGGARGRGRSALRQSGGPGANGGIHVGDHLLSIEGVPIKQATDVTKVLVRIGPWSKAQYQVNSRGVEVTPTLVIAAAPMDRAVMYQYLVGAAYLLIGLFVYFRRGSAHKAQHFYILCLTSFIFFSFHYTGHLDSFDKIIYFGNLLAGLIAPTVFLHFCLTFPEPRPWIARPARMALLYVPAAVFFLVYIGFTSGAMSIAVPLIELRWMLDRVWMVFATLPYLIGGFALQAEYHRTEDTITRQQLKWLRNGAFCGILPFALLYVLPYVLGAVPNSYMKMSVLSVMLVPLTLAYAIVRYRLMDVDIIFRRGYAYTLATVCVLAAFYGIVFGVGQSGQPELQGPGEYRPDDRDADHGIPVPADPQLDSGAAGQALLPGPLRLPAHAGGVRPRTGLGDRSGRDAGQRRRPPAGDAADQAPGLPAGRGLGGRAALPPQEGDGVELRGSTRLPPRTWT